VLSLWRNSCAFRFCVSFSGCWLLNFVAADCFCNFSEQSHPLSALFCCSLSDAGAAAYYD
jgi:hypothetical protein